MSAVYPVMKAVPYDTRTRHTATVTRIPQCTAMARTSPRPPPPPDLPVVAPWFQWKKTTADLPKGAYQYDDYTYSFQKIIWIQFGDFCSV